MSKLIIVFYPVEEANMKDMNKEVKNLEELFAKKGLKVEITIKLLEVLAQEEVAVEGEVVEKPKKAGKKTKKTAKKEEAEDVEEEEEEEAPKKKKKAGAKKAKKNPKVVKAVKNFLEGKNEDYNLEELEDEASDFVAKACELLEVKELDELKTLEELEQVFALFDLCFDECDEEDEEEIAEEAVEIEDLTLDMIEED